MMVERELLGKNIEDVQRLNQVSVLQVLRQNGVISRKQISDYVGLTPGTVTNIVRDLIEAGYVIETGFLSGKKGRRAVGLTINPEGFYVMGVRLSRASIVCRIYNPNAEVIVSKKVPIEDFERAQQVLNCMLDSMGEVIEESGVAGKLQAIGVSTPGPLNLKEGKITYLHGNIDWRDVPIRQLVQDRFGIPTILEHDANAAALAEVLFGEAKDVNNLVYVAVGRGIGAGIILKGEPYHGSLGTAGQLGHVSVNLDGPRCQCGGSGCLTNYSSSKAFIKRMQHLGVDTKGEINGLVDLAKQGNKTVYEEVVKAAHYTGVAVASAVNLLNPEVIIFGDEMTWFGPLWFNTAKETVLSRLAPEIAQGVDVRLSSFGQDAFLLGTGAIALEYVCQNPVMNR